MLRYALLDRDSVTSTPREQHHHRLPLHTHTHAHARPALRHVLARLGRVLQRPASALVACVLCFVVLGWLYLRPWSTVWLVSPARYHSTLRQTVLASFPEHLQSELLGAIDRPPTPETQKASSSSSSSSDNNYHTPNSPNTNTNSTLLIPPVLFQTDVRQPSPADQQSWLAHGFEQRFFDDADAAAWVEQHFGGSEVARTYAELPLPILCVIVAVICT